MINNCCWPLAGSAQRFLCKNCCPYFAPLVVVSPDRWAWPIVGLRVLSPWQFLLGVWIMSWFIPWHNYLFSNSSIKHLASDPSPATKITERLFTKVQLSSLIMFIFVSRSSTGFKQLSKSLSLRQPFPDEIVIINLKGGLIFAPLRVN